MNQDFIGSAVTVIRVLQRILDILANYKFQKPQNSRECVQDALGRFEAFSQVAAESYGDYTLRATHPPIRKDGWHFEFDRVLSGGALWVWKVTPPRGPTSHVFVVRGSFTVFDWAYRNIRLALGSKRFCEVLDFYIQTVADYIEILVKREKDLTVMFCGHSLGASIAEALHCKCNAGALYPGVYSVGCVTFDSPGQPEQFRSDKKNGFNEQSLKHMWTLNAPPNVINMLYPPRAVNFYACGMGSQLQISDLLSIPMSSVSAFLLGIGRAILQSTAGHCLDKIRIFIRMRYIGREHAESWPNLSGWFLQMCGIQEMPTTVDPEMSECDAIPAIPIPAIPIEEQPSDSDKIEPLTPYHSSRYRHTFQAAIKFMPLVGPAVNMCRNIWIGDYAAAAGDAFSCAADVAMIGGVVPVWRIAPLYYYLRKATPVGTVTKWACVGGANSISDLWRFVGLTDAVRAIAR